MMTFLKVRTLKALQIIIEGFAGPPAHHIGDELNESGVVSHLGQAERIPVYVVPPSSQVKVTRDDGLKIELRKVK